MKHCLSSFTIVCMNSWRQIFFFSMADGENLKSHFGQVTVTSWIPNLGFFLHIWRFSLTFTGVPRGGWSSLSMLDGFSGDDISDWAASISSLSCAAAAVAVAFGMVASTHFLLYGGSIERSLGAFRARLGITLVGLVAGTGLGCISVGLPSGKCCKKHIVSFLVEREYGNY